MPGEPRALWASNRVCEAAVRHRKQEQHLSNLRSVRATHTRSTHPLLDRRHTHQAVAYKSK